MYTTKQSTAIASLTLAVNNSTATASTLFVSYISPALAAQTISGTFAAQALFSIANATGATTIPRFAVFVINSAGTVVATLLAATTNATTLTTTLTNRSIPPATTITSYTCADGDRIMVEIGIVRTAGTTARNGSIQFGDNQASDVAVNNTATGTTANSWAEFSGNLTFYTPIGNPMMMAFD